LDRTGDVIFYDNKAKNTGIAIATARLFNSIPSTNLILFYDLLGPNFVPCEKIRKPVRLLTEIVKKKPARLIDGHPWPFR